MFFLPFVSKILHYFHIIMEGKVFMLLKLWSSETYK